MTPQVMIEAKIVEASLDFSRELGAVWSFGTNPLTDARRSSGRDATSAARTAGCTTSNNRRVRQPDHGRSRPGS